MKILLCVSHNPSYLRIKSSDLAIYPALGLAYIASYLRKAGHDVVILDNKIKRLDTAGFKAFVRNFSPDLIGFTAYTFNMNISLVLARSAKEAAPRSKVIFGGPHPTCLPKETLMHGEVDMVVVGEGEETLCEVAGALLSQKPLQGIRGLWYKEGGKILQNPSRDFIEDLDSMPMPSYDLLDMGSYYQSVSRRFSNKKFGTIITGRGCPYRCTFCSNHNLGKKARLRSPENVVDELEYLVKNYGIEEFMFVDDTFTIDRKRTIAICELIMKRHLKIVWTCNTRANDASEELYSFLARAGCKSFFLGVEAGTQDMLDRMKKDITLAQIENAVLWGKKHVGHVICSFIFGLPGDDLGRARKTIQFAKRLNPDIALFTIACPAPGSALFDAAVREGALDPLTSNWDNFSVFFPYLPTIEMSDISRRDLVRLTKVALWEFYARPNYIWRRLTQLKSPVEFFNIIRGFFASLNYISTKVT